MSEGGAQKSALETEQGAVRLPNLSDTPTIFTNPVLWAYGGAIRGAGQRPGWRPLRAGIFCRLFFVDINAQARLLVRIHIAFPHFGAAGEDLLQLFAKAAPFLYTKV